ncbi:MAG: VanW family protein [Lachnospiraceae bacterium]|nr:VanW family protein [Lachnospiraceae bacterium]
MKKFWLVICMLFALTAQTVSAAEIFERIEEEDAVQGDILEEIPAAEEEAIDAHVQAVTMLEDVKILPGVTIGKVDVSGLSAQEAQAAVNAQMAALKARTLTLKGETEAQKEISLGELGLMWENEEVLTQALSLGHAGNPVKRYKDKKDHDHAPVAYELALLFDDTTLRNVLTTQCDALAQEAIDYELHREDGAFQITEGQSGFSINVNASIQTLQDFLAEGASDDVTILSIAVEEEKPKGSYEELSRVKDVLGTFSTNYRTSSNARSANIANGCRLTQGVTIYPGEEYSVLDHMQPFTEANGYYLAGSYLNGQVVDSLGGGICQVSTTLYNAVLRSELEVTERHNHSMIVSYVQPSMDAAIAESSEKDFKFVNNTAHPIYIDGYTEGKNITFTIYGVEERAGSHKVRYEPETVSTTPAGPEVIHADASQPIGFVDVQSAHVGYKARLWRITTENGEETERVIINESNYKMVPRTATVGTATDNPANLSIINSAIASGSIDQVKSTAAALRNSAQATDPAALAAATYEAAVASGDANAIAAAEQLMQQVAAAGQPPVDVPE